MSISVPGTQTAPHALSWRGYVMVLGLLILALSLVSTTAPARPDLRRSTEVSLSPDDTKPALYSPDHTSSDASDSDGSESAGNAPTHANVGRPARGVTPAPPQPQPGRPFCQRPPYELPSWQVPLRHLQPRYSGSGIREWLRDEAAVCELMLLSLPVCCVLSAEEDVYGCIRRVGWVALDRRLPTRCTRSAWWKQQESQRGVAQSDRLESWRRPVRDDDLASYPDLFRSQVNWVAPGANNARKDEEGPDPHAPPSPTGGSGWHDATRRGQVYRQVPLAATATCDFNHPIHQVVFTSPESNFLPRPTRTADRVSRFKLFDFSPILPLSYRSFRKHGYALGRHDEWLSMLLYRYSYFAVTHRRGGWDCLRHYEELAAGTVPLMHDIGMCGPLCLSFLPKALLRRALVMPGVAYLGGGGALEPRRAHSFQQTLAALNGNYIREYRGRFDYVRVPVIDGGAASGAGDIGLFGNPSFPPQTQQPVPALPMNLTEYFEIADALMRHSRRHLTTQALAAHVLSVMLGTASEAAASSTPPPKRVLVISQPHDDYLSSALQNGLSALGVPFAATAVNANQIQVPLHPGGPTPPSVAALEVAIDAGANAHMPVESVAAQEPVVLVGPGSGINDEYAAEGARLLKAAAAVPQGEYGLGFGYSRRMATRPVLAFPTDHPAVAAAIMSGTYDVILVTSIEPIGPKQEAQRVQLLPVIEAAKQRGVPIGFFNGDDHDQDCRRAAWIFDAAAGGGRHHVFYREMWDA